MKVPLFLAFDLPRSDPILALEPRIMRSATAVNRDGRVNSEPQ